MTTNIKALLAGVCLAMIADLAQAQGQTNAPASTNQPAAAQTNAPASTNQPARPRPNVHPSTNQWHSTVALGLTIARGNTDTTLVSLSARTEKKWPLNNLALGADALYGESKLPGQSTSTETADSQKGFGQYDRTLSDRFYAYGRLEALHDGIADIEYRFTLAPGAGYYFIKNKSADLSVELGPGYIDEKLDDHTHDYATLRAAEKFHYTLSPHARLWETIEYLPEVDELDNYIVNAELGVEAGLNKKNNVTLRTVLQDSYDNVPAPGRLKNDLKLIAAVAYKF
ncbi:MAG: DUF481 domain-containing protein [Verrucomicrobiota bacterium]|jgi:putative salt-induced outer membrane protein YdiY